MFTAYKTEKGELANVRGAVFAETVSHKRASLGAYCMTVPKVSLFGKKRNLRELVDCGIYLLDGILCGTELERAGMSGFFLVSDGD